MPIYAQIDDTGLVVAEVQTSAPIDGPHIVASPGGMLGYTWDGTDFIPPAPVALPRHISVGSFFDRFGAEKWAILADGAPAVRAVVQDASVRRYIDLDNPQLPAGLAILQAAGHAIDAEAILSAPVQPEER